VVGTTPNEIPRHRFAQAVAANRHVHTFGGLREKQRGLPGGDWRRDSLDLFSTERQKQAIYL
jgi:hypothetical protein